MRRPVVVVRIALLLVIGLVGTPARATITISPAQPTTADSVRVTVRGGFLDYRWNSIGQATCQAYPSDTLEVSVPVNYCGGVPSCVANDLPFTYSRTCNFGLLPAGSYVARFAEQHVNPSDPLPGFAQTVQFTVAMASTPALRRSWGSLKSIYR